MKETAGVLALAALPASVPGQVLSFSARSDLVVFSATAVDRRGRPVTDLRREEFRIYEEGRPQPIAHFQGGRGLPARVLLLVDASGSMGEETKVASARRAARQIIDALAPEDQVAVAGFDSRYWGVVAFTRDREAVRRGLDSITPFGSTALHDALDKAARDIASHGEGRRAVVVLTDGVDTSSEKKADEVIARSRALDVPIYTVSVVSPLDDPRSPSFLVPKHAGEATAAQKMKTGSRRSKAEPVGTCSRSPAARPSSKRYTGWSRAFPHFRLAWRTGCCMSLRVWRTRRRGEGETRRVLSPHPRVPLSPCPRAPARLTERQMEVLRLVASGLTYKEVGKKLSLSEVTVRYHMSEIMHLLHLENRSQLIAYAARHDLTA